MGPLISPPPTSNTHTLHTMQYGTRVQPTSHHLYDSTPPPDPHSRKTIPLMLFCPRLFLLHSLPLPRAGPASFRCVTDWQPEAVKALEDTLQDYSASAKWRELLQAVAKSGIPSVSIAAQGLLAARRCVMHCRWGWVGAGGCRWVQGLCAVCVVPSFPGTRSCFRHKQKHSKSMNFQLHALRKMKSAKKNRKKFVPPPQGCIRGPQ